jgi:hypothetical protein
MIEMNYNQLRIVTLTHVNAALQDITANLSNHTVIRILRPKFLWFINSR